MRINNFEFTVGADPEFFVKKDGALVSAYGLIPGDKKNPHPVKCGSVQVDGMALEFNIDPAKDLKTFDKNLSTVLEELRKMTPGHEFEFTPLAEFGKEYIARQPLVARVLGCEPDYNAYTKAPNPAPNGDAGFRTASGHIHIGWKKLDDPKWPKAIDPMDVGHFEACCALAKVLDAYVGAPSIAFDHVVDGGVASKKRRELYGKAGAFRPKPYGMEYRVASNSWLMRPEWRALVFGNAMDGIKALFEDEDLPSKQYYGKTAQQIIDTFDIDTVAKMFRGGVIKSAKTYRENMADLELKD